MSLMVLSEVDRVELSSYYVFKSNLQQVVRANFQLHEIWATSNDVTRSEEEKSRIIAQVQDRFQNGPQVPISYIFNAISKSLKDKQNHERTRIRQYFHSTTIDLMTAHDIKKKGCPESGKIDRGY